MEPNDQMRTVTQNVPTEPVAAADSMAPTSQGEPLKPATLSEASKKKPGKGLLVGMMVFMVLAIGGVGLGVYGITQSLEKDARIRQLETEKEEISEKLEQYVEIWGEWDDVDDLEEEDDEEYYDDFDYGDFESEDEGDSVDTDEVVSEDEELTDETDNLEE